MNRDTIRKVLGEFDGGERTYPGPLPSELDHPGGVAGLLSRKL